MMAAIKGKDTKPELLLRKALFSHGYRYRLHDRKLPGRPDMIFRKFNAVIFVNGCFWHGHDCSLFRWPKTRETFWREKIQGNMARDIRNHAACTELGLRTLVVWECSMKGKERLSLNTVVQRVIGWLESDEPHGIIRGEPG